MKPLNSQYLKTIKELLSCSSFAAASLQQALDQIAEHDGIQVAYNVLMQAEASLNLRRPSLGLYDHTAHIIGGGQKYGFTVAHALQDIFDVTLIVNKNVTLKDITDWYHLDLSRCTIKVIDIPFFDQFNSPHLDPARISKRIPNPFHIISRESGNYDFFINNSMNEMVYPLANVSSLICHFPERRPRSYFYADQYTHVIYNSRYTASWIQERWKFTPHKHIYPPVDMEPPTAEIRENPKKENIILSVARFEAGGSKKQLDMVKTFIKLNRHFPGLMKEWQLVLAGGSADQNQYLAKIKEAIKESGLDTIRLLINTPGDTLKEMYRKASIFWHICGLDQTDPALIEHFGMTIVEAMQNRIAPIVFDGGGQREIVDHGINGFRITSSAQLLACSLKLLTDPSLRDQLGNSAFEKSKIFSRQCFEKNVKDFFTQELNKYLSL